MMAPMAPIEGDESFREGPGQRGKIYFHLHQDQLPDFNKKKLVAIFRGRDPKLIVLGSDPILMVGGPASPDQISRR